MFDVIIYGATPGGIGAAVAARRRGRKVLLLEPSRHIGGMMTGGLGRTDIVEREASGSIFHEFMTRVLEHYVTTYGPDSEQVKQCNRGLWFEPSVAALVLREWAGDVAPGFVLRDVVVENGRVRSISDGHAVHEGRVFIDATYEGDLAAMAGVPFSLGRESRADWYEEYAGKLYMNYDTKEVLPGSTGEGDDLVQAYNFRLCLTQNPDNRAPFVKPERYNRADYAALVEDVAAGRVTSIRKVMSILPVPNGKTDANNHHTCSLSTDLPGENTAYPTGDAATREAVVERHRAYIQGLLWFLQNDEELPEWFRAECREWGYAADEFPDTGHFPPQIYVREARRIHGEYLFTESDARLAPGLDRAPIHFDAIAMGDYHIDSHAVRKREPAGQNQALEGFLGLDWITKLYQIPYGVMVPQQVDDLLVPVAVSATHQGFGTIRMEPVWLQLGFAAGLAADLALSQGVTVRDLPVDYLQHELLKVGQRLSYFADVPWDSPARPAMEYFGTKGFFPSYTAKPSYPLTVAEASQWIALARTLPGGRRLPVLPATDRVLPPGVDMGPRRPTKETRFPDYWAANPLLSVQHARMWLSNAAKAVGAEVPEVVGNQERTVTRGEFCQWLYSLLVK